MKNMKNSELIIDLSKIWNDKDKNIHESLVTLSGTEKRDKIAEFKHEEEDKYLESY